MYRFTAREAYEMWCYNHQFTDNLPQADIPPMTEQEELTYLEQLMREENPE